ncbi:MAG TPA: hypothetical protein VF407_18140 [Polyangiaceae bacterium]
MSHHWYAVGDDIWQPLLAPEGQEEFVLEVLSQAMPGVPVRWAEGPEKTEKASCITQEGSRDVVYTRSPSTPPARSA